MFLTADVAYKLLTALNRAGIPVYATDESTAKAMEAACAALQPLADRFNVAAIAAKEMHDSCDYDPREKGYGGMFSCVDAQAVKKIYNAFDIPIGTAEPEPEPEPA